MGPAWGMRHSHREWFLVIKASEKIGLKAARTWMTQATLRGSGPAGFPGGKCRIREPSDNGSGPVRGAKRYHFRCFLMIRASEEIGLDAGRTGMVPALRRAPERDDRELPLVVNELNGERELSACILLGPCERMSAARFPRPSRPWLESGFPVRRREPVEHLARSTASQTLMRPVFLEPPEVERQLLLEPLSRERRPDDARHLALQRPEEPLDYCRFRVN